MLTICALLTMGGVPGQPLLEVQPGTARPGDAVLVEVRHIEGKPSGTLAGRTLKFFRVPHGYRAITGLSVETGPGTLPVVVKLPGSAKLTGQLEVVEPNFNRRQLSVAGKYVAPPAKVKKWMAEDRAAFAKAFATFERRWLFEGNFAWPRPPIITAPFGDLRLFNGKKKSQHFGTDLDGRTGDPVYATQAGRVVMKRECYAAGNTILVHHGGDLFSAYFHLSRFEVEEGEEVTQGQRLGEVGKSGRVTGPHLHWGIKVDNRWVDGESLLRLNFTPPTDAIGPTTSELASPETPSPPPLHLPPAH